MASKMVGVTSDQMQELKQLAEIIQNPTLPLSQRRIAKAQYEAIIKLAKMQNHRKTAFS